MVSTTPIPQSGRAFSPEYWPTNEAPEGLIILGDVNNYPDNCHPHQIALLITRFFDAYSNGNVDQLTHFFNQDFQASGIVGWFSDTILSAEASDNKRHFVARNHEELLDYLTSRREHSEKLKLLVLQVTARSSQSNTVDIGFVYRRQAKDLEPGADGLTRIGNGKGVVDCATQKIIVWSMALPAEDPNEEEIFHRISSCTRFFEDIPDKIIVCARANR